MPYHKRGVYDGFDSPAEMRRHYKRCRTLKHFKPSAAFVERANPKCPVCGKTCSDLSDASEGYRGWHGLYLPRTKSYRVMHYLCSWGALLRDVFSVRKAGV
jgi:hypothetical protein